MPDKFRAKPEGHAMIFGLFRRSANDTVIDRLYGLIVAASRQPQLYLDMKIPDTFEGRFESLTLHAALVLRRLRDSEVPGPDMAQHLVDTLFKHFDRMLREMGVGDTSVPKRMKTLAEAFLGRSKAYDEALRSGPNALGTVLRRNVYVNTVAGTALARYVFAAEAAFATMPMQMFVDGKVTFPDASAFAEETTV